MRWITVIALLLIGALLGRSDEVYAPKLPKGAVKYEVAIHTQEIAVTNGYDRITPVRRGLLKREWQMSGGMVDLEATALKGVKSEKYQSLPAPPKTWVGNIAVVNSFGHTQYNRGIVREYVDGSRFDDVLYYRGVVFEHRVREKSGGKWKSSVIYSSEKSRPPGYKGLGKSCASCHDQAGSGGYAEGLVPGGDGVISDPLDWSVTRGYMQ